jgi:hypothetical protein
VFPIMFKTGQALLLPGGRSWSPRHGRETGAEQPRNFTGSWSQTRHFHESEPGQDRTQLRIGHVREQSVIAFSPRQQSRPRTVRVRAQATASIVREKAEAADVNPPQTIRSLKQSSPTNWSQTRFVRNRGPATIDPRPRIVVSAWVTANFLVPIHIILPYEHV